MPVEFSGDWTAARVSVGGRLTFGLIDLNGFSGRRYGSAALAVQEPSFQAVVELAPTSVISVVAEDPEQRTAIEQFVSKLQREVNGPGAAIVVSGGIPAHRGFGSKTLTVLNAGRAYLALCGVEMSVEKLAVLAGRGGTGGASVSLVGRGGFIVDGGHQNSSRFEQDQHQHLIDDVPIRTPPVICALDFPDWPVLVIVPHGQGLAGPPEKEWFAGQVPLSREQAMKMAHVVLMNLAPSIAEADFEGFCSAVNRITLESEFKQAQIRAQSRETKIVLAEARNHVDAIGMSSMGPACFAFARDIDAAAAWARGLRAEGIVVSAYVTHARNQESVVEFLR